MTFDSSKCYNIIEDQPMLFKKLYFMRFLDLMDTAVSSPTVSENETRKA